MNRDTRELLEEALRLPPEVRAALAGSLLESLEEHIDQDAEAAWRADLERRIRDLDSGNVRSVPWTEARERILKR
jgi:putative addiction module component (TIGR02574 family)